MLLKPLFHAWERRLASVTKNRVVRPFEWGLDWIPSNGNAPDAPPHEVVRTWVTHVMNDTDAFFTPAPTSDYTLTGDLLTFPSALTTPHTKGAQLTISPMLQSVTARLRVRLPSSVCGD